MAICRNLTKQLCSISLSHNVSRPGLGQGGFSNTARVYLDVTKKLYVVNQNEFHQNEFHASVHGQEDSSTNWISSEVKAQYLVVLNGRAGIPPHTKIVYYQFNFKIT